MVVVNSSVGKGCWKCVTRRGVEVRYLDDYIRGGHGFVEKRILQVKQKMRLEIEYYVDLLEGALTKTCAVCNVPSHDPRNPEPGVRKIVMGLTRSMRLDASGCLVRTSAIPKLSQGGERRTGIHLSSVKLVEANRISDRDVVILDDVVTSGSSLRACSQIVSGARPRSITLVALGCA